jgi:hypothetical protein
MKAFDCMIQGTNGMLLYVKLNIEEIKIKGISLI